MGDSKESGEVGAHSLDNFNSALERWHDTQRARRTFEDYIEGHADIHVHYVFGCAELEARNLCAILKPQQRYVAVQSGGPVLDGDDISTGAINDGDAGQKQPMFIGVIELMKEHEGVLVPTLSVIERLQPLDQCRCLRSDPVVDVAFHAFERVGVLVNGKFSVRSFFDLTGIPSSDEPPKDVIEGRSGIVKAIADHQRPVDQRRGRDDTQSKDVLPGLRVAFLNNGVRLSLNDEGGNSGLKGVQVLLCPADLRVKSDR
jgi:hypothetical protein